jgi:hypothetical protein
MQIIRLAWLAGIIDGEGGFSIFNRTNISKNGNVIHTPSASITITNSNVSIIDECVQILKELEIKFVLKNPKNSTTRTLERLDIRNYSSLLKLIDAVNPYLIGKKEQAVAMKEFVSKASKRVGFKVTDERVKFLALMSKLNKSGQVIRRDYTPDSPDFIGG